MSSLICRLSSASESGSDEQTHLSHFYEDHDLPVFLQASTGYSLSDLVDILMSNSLPEEKVCMVQPLGVNRNCTFIIDLDLVRVEDIKADELGLWKSNGTR